ncbi:methyl-accepting chemotaxis protein [Rhodoblastus acidophilus]|uniref:methyl-accepting chemotaxis protein n=1 Tax=Rhodoblastus acidophilus TaxID=1074 RepID=UPI002224BD1A|nr:methyl-accepting chemotaxis protein [Rhodoblastus acidophilus]
MALSHLNIRAKLLLIFAAAMILIFGVVGFGASRASLGLTAFETQVMAGESDAIRVEAMENAFKTQVQEWKNVLLRGKKPEALSKYWKQFEEQEADVRARCARLQQSVTDPEAASLLTQFTAAHDALGKAYRAGLEKFRDAGFDSAAGDAAVTGIDRQPTELLTQARKRLVALAEATAATVAGETHQAMQFSLIALLAVGAAAVALFVVTVNGTISHPLAKVVATLERLAGGDIAITVEGVTRKDEIGVLARSVDVFRKLMAERENVRQAQERQREENLKAQRQATLALADSLENRVRDIVMAIAAASRELHGAANALSANAEQTKRQISTVATATDQASANVVTVASAGTELSASITEISRQASQAASTVEAAAAEAGAVTRTVAQLSDSAARIGEVVILIDNIASQTNLLALNATIEAARAGEAGKGFAVVASEVKTLASGTAKATQEIISQINTVQHETDAAVAAIEGMTRTIGRIHEMSGAIAAAVEEQGAATAEIAVHVDEASQRTREVAANGHGVAQAAGETGEMAVIVLKSTETLMGQSQTLERAMSSFLAEIRGAA